MNTGLHLVKFLYILAKPLFPCKEFASLRISRNLLNRANFSTQLIVILLYTRESTNVYSLIDVYSLIVAFTIRTIPLLKRFH